MRHRDGADAGLLRMVAVAALSHRVTAALVAIAAIALCIGLTAFNARAPAYDVLRDYLGGDTSEDRDDVFLSALLEMKDGQWRVSQAQAIPVAGLGTFRVTHESVDGRLETHAPVVWTVGAAGRRRRAADWSIVSRYRIAPDGPGPALATWEIRVEVHGERSGGYPVVADRGVVCVGSGAGILAPTRVRRIVPSPESGRLLHLIALAPAGTGSPDDVETWRTLVRDAVLADTPGEAVGARARERVDDVAALLGLRDVLEERGRRPFRTRDGGVVDATRIADLAGGFARPAQVLAWLRETYRDDPDVSAAAQGLLDSTYRWDDLEPLPAPDLPTFPYLVPVAALSLLLNFPAGVATPLRRRDVQALFIALVLASVGLRLVEHVALETFGLMAAALQISRLRRRRAITIPPGVPHAFAIAAVLLPLASMTRLPTVDALGRALAFVGVAALAAARVAPAPTQSASPRAAGDGQRVASTSVQIVAVLLAVLALIVIELEPWEWTRGPPHPRWSWFCGGLALAAVAGIVTFARSRIPRPQPITACAVTVAAAVHIATLAVSTLPFDRLPGERGLGVTSAIATTLLVVVAIARMDSVAVAARATR